MKKILFAALATTVFIAAPAMANTDTTFIQGTVSAVCQLDAPNDTQVALTGTTALSSPLLMTCNDPNGYTLGLTSLNGFQLEADTDSATVYTYKLTSPLGETSVDVGVSYPASQAAIDGLTVPVTFEIVSASGPAYAGNYQDTLTWTLTAN